MKLFHYVRRFTNAGRVFPHARRLWALPRRVDIAVLDGTNVSFLIPLFGTHSYEVIYVGGEAIYVHPRVLLRALRHVIATRQLTVGYVLAVLEQMKPSIVVTFVDNSPLVYTTAHRYRAARFLAIQNGNRLPARDNPPGTPAIYFREFACLGRFEIDQFIRHGARVDTYYPIGSLKDSYYRAQRANGGPARKEFDLCVPSQFKASTRRIHSERLDGFELLMEHVRRFADAHGATVCVPLRYYPDYRDQAAYTWEREFFEARLGECARVIPNVPGAYTTYAMADRSRVSIGMHTTVLREAFGRGNRILSCNYTGNPVYTFPVPGPWTLTDSTYEAFEQRLMWLLNASEEEYTHACGDLPSYLIGYDDRLPTHVFLQRLITDAVRGAAAPARD